MDMGAVALVTAILAMSVCTTAFKPVNFKPLTFAQHLNKFFGVSIRKPTKNSGGPTGKYTEASGTVDGVDVVLSGPETGSKQSTSLPSADQVNIDSQETLTPPTPPHQLPAFNKTLFESTSSDAGGNSPKLLLPDTLVPQAGSKTSTPTPSLNQVNIDIQETLTPPTRPHQLPAFNKTLFKSTSSDAGGNSPKLLLPDTLVPHVGSKTSTPTPSLNQVNIDIQETLTPPTRPHQLPAFNKTLFKSTSSDAGGNSPKLLLPDTLVPHVGSKTSTPTPSLNQVNIDIQETLTPPTPQHQLPAFKKTLFKSTSSDAGGNSPKLLLPDTLVPHVGSKTSTPTPSLNQVNIDIQETLTPPTRRHQLPASNKTVLTSSTIVSNVLLHETTVPTTARQTKNITMSKKSDIRKKIQLLFVTLVKQIAGLETKSRGFGIIPREAQIESDGEGIPVSFSKLAGRVLALSEALLAYVKNESYSEGAEARFSDRQYAGTLETHRITKPSGMAFSNIHEDVMYVINDGDSEAGPVILALNKTGELLNYFKLKGASNNDWAALQIAPCSSTTSRSCIYIGDIDDPDGPKGTTNIIYICQEPEDLMGGHQLHIEDRIRIKNIDDSSMVMIVSPRAEIYLIPQRKHESTVYKISKGKITAVCQFKFESKWSGPVDGDISADGDMMLIKTYDFVYYFYVPEKDYPEALCYHTTRAQLKYTWELYGEVVTFSPDAMSYYTCNLQLYSPLWRYDRLKIKEVDY